MSTNAKRFTARRCRAVIVAKDGKRFLTRWRAHKDVNELGPDEPWPMQLAIRSAERYAKRKGIEVRSIDAQFTVRAPS